jgi:L-threonylcarbamoyladenylate synthase
MRKYWPGGVTIVLPATTAFVSPLVKGKSNTLAVRMPDKKEIIEIIEKMDVPIIGTSANFAGEKTPFSFEELDEELMGKVDFVLKGNCEKGISSTVLDATQKPWKILRQGAVSVEF